MILAEDAPPPPKDPLPKMTVGECIAFAMTHQPKLTALQASIGSAQAGLSGIESARWAAHLTPGYKERVQQANAGVSAASAEFEQAKYEVTQAVIWNYYAVVYARSQVKVASEAVDFVDHYRKQVADIVNDKGGKGGTREINQITLDRLVGKLSEGEILLVHAQFGVEKARAALREAMGADCNFLFDVADDELPDFGKTELDRDTIVTHAKTRRGEVIMAGLAAEVTRLEAYVQWAHCFRLRTQTFAVGADIHSRPIPPGSKDGDYRPDAMGPEMPTHFFGDRKTRTQRAWELAARSRAVLQKTTDLVVLEADNALIDFNEAGKTMAIALRQANAGKNNVKRLQEVAGEKVSSAATLESLLEGQGTSARGQAAYNEAVYKRIVALANLERITAGGVKVNYPGR